jgi:type II secretory pathway predicted ATPase ExeA
MYEQHFGLDKRPFDQTPDSEFLYLSEQHGFALASMKFAIAKRDAFVIVTGDVGSGKTTLLNRLLSELEEGLVVSRVNHTQLSDVELLQLLLAEFGIRAFDKQKAELIYMLREHVLEQYQAGRQVVFMIDEAQNLGGQVLEELRLLSTIETEKEKQVTILLVGQPQLNELVDHPDLEQLRQRCRLRLHLEPLPEEDTEAYLRHRLEVAGGAFEEVFEAETVSQVYRHSGGVPRLINTLCDTALTACVVKDAPRITTAIIDDVVEELGWRRSQGLDPDRAETLSRKIGLHVTVTGKGGEEKEYVLTEPNALIGRSRSCDIPVKTAFASRRHAILSREGAIWSISDLNSTNGLTVNGERVHNHVLADGDVIQIGNHSLTCHLVTADDAETTRSPALVENDEHAATRVLGDGSAQDAGYDPDDDAGYDPYGRARSRTASS